MPFRLVYEMEEYVVDGAADERTEIKEFAVDAVERRLKEVTLAGILRIEELEEIEYKRLIDVPLGEVGIEVGALYKSEEELVDDLEVGPGEF